MGNMDLLLLIGIGLEVEQVDKVGKGSEEVRREISLVRLKVVKWES